MCFTGVAIFYKLKARPSTSKKVYNSLQYLLFCGCLELNHQYLQSMPLVSYNTFYFCSISCNVSSFIPDFICLLSFSFFTLVKCLSILFIFSKSQPLILLVLCCLSSFYYTYFYSDLSYFLPSTNFGLSLFLLFLIPLSVKLGYLLEIFLFHNVGFCLRSSFSLLYFWPEAELWKEAFTLLQELDNLGMNSSFATPWLLHLQGTFTSLNKKFLILRMGILKYMNSSNSWTLLGLTIHRSYWVFAVPHTSHTFPFLLAQFKSHSQLV